MDVDLNEYGKPGGIVAVLVSVVLGFRYALKAFAKDSVDLNATGATSSVITHLREEVQRLSTNNTELAISNKELRTERDELSTNVNKLNYTVETLLELSTGLVGEEEVFQRLKSRGIKISR